MNILFWIGNYVFAKGNTIKNEKSYDLKNIFSNISLNEFSRKVYKFVCQTKYTSECQMRITHEFCDLLVKNFKDNSNDAKLIMDRLPEFSKSSDIDVNAILLVIYWYIRDREMNINPENNPFCEGQLEIDYNYVLKYYKNFKGDSALRSKSCTLLKKAVGFNQLMKCYSDSLMFQENKDVFRSLRKTYFYEMKQLTLHKCISNISTHENIELLVHGYTNNCINIKSILNIIIEFCFEENQFYFIDHHTKIFDPNWTADSSELDFVLLLEKIMDKDNDGIHLKFWRCKLYGHYY